MSHKSSFDDTINHLKSSQDASIQPSQQSFQLINANKKTTDFDIQECDWSNNIGPKGTEIFSQNIQQEPENFKQKRDFNQDLEESIQISEGSIMKYYTNKQKSIIKTNTSSNIKKDHKIKIAEPQIIEDYITNSVYSKKHSRKSIAGKNYRKRNDTEVMSNAGGINDTFFESQDRNMLMSRKEERLQQSLQKILQITKFLRIKKKLLQYSSSYIRKQQTHKHLKLIEDQSTTIDEISTITYIFSFIDVFSPHSMFCTSWNIVKLIIILISLYWLPMRVTFSVQSTSSQNLQDVFMMIYGVVDILVTFNIGVFDEGSISTDRKKICQQYLKGEFFYDIVGTIGFLMNLIYRYEDQIILYLFMFRAFQISSILNDLENVYQIESKFTTQYQLIKLLCIITLVAHLCAINFYTVARVEMENGETSSWIQENGYDETVEWDIIYVEALYFSFITMITVGYGDISPTTYTEKIISIVITIISCGVFAYAVNTIDIIIRDKQHKESRIKLKKFNVKQYMMKRNISKENQMKVIKALEYVDKQEEQENTAGLQILQSISKNIQDSIFTEYYGKILYNTHIAKQGRYSKPFLQNMALKLKETIIGPGHVLYQQNEVASKFFILVEGAIEVYFKNKDSSQMEDKVINVLKGIHEIGYKIFYCQQPIEYSMRSQNVSRLVYFERDDFISELKKFPEDYEKFCYIKDNLLFNQVWHAEQCYSCGSVVHTSNNCPHIFLSQRDQIIYGKRNYETMQQQEQIRYYRRQRIKYDKKLEYVDFRVHTLLGVEDIREEVMRIRTDLVSAIQNDFYDYDLNERDKDFYYNTPELRFREDNTYYVIDEVNSEEEEFFQMSSDDEYSFEDVNNEDMYSNDEEDENHYLIQQQQLAEQNKMQASHQRSVDRKLSQTQQFQKQLSFTDCNSPIRRRSMRRKKSTLVPTVSPVRPYGRQNSKVQNFQQFQQSMQQFQMGASNQQQIQQYQASSKQQQQQQLNENNNNLQIIDQQNFNSIFKQLENKVLNQPRIDEQTDYSKKTQTHNTFSASMNSCNTIEIEATENIQKVIQQQYNEKLKKGQTINSLTYLKEVDEELQQLESKNNVDFEKLILKTNNVNINTTNANNVNNNPENTNSPNNSSTNNINNKLNSFQYYEDQSSIIQKHKLLQPQQVQQNTNNNMNTSSQRKMLNSNTVFTTKLQMQNHKNEQNQKRKNYRKSVSQMTPLELKQVYLPSTQIRKKSQKNSHLKKKLSDTQLLQQLIVLNIKQQQQIMNTLENNQRGIHQQTRIIQPQNQGNNINIIYPSMNRSKQFNPASNYMQSSNNNLNINSSKNNLNNNNNNTNNNQSLAETKQSLQSIDFVNINSANNNSNNNNANNNNEKLEKGTNQEISQQNLQQQQQQQQQQQVSKPNSVYTKENFSMKQYQGNSNLKQFNTMNLFSQYQNQSKMVMEPVKKMDFFIVNNMDRIKNYELYFPLFNYDKILKIIQEKHHQLLKNKYGWLNKTDAQMNRKQRILKQKFENRKKSMGGNATSFANLKFVNDI